jgi:hypothetical protein
MTGKPVKVAKGMRNRRTQRALLQFFKPENWFEVKQALEEAGRRDLIGSGCDCLIPDRPPGEALERRRRDANRAFEEQTSGDHIRGGPAAGAGKREQRRRGSIGYRPRRPGERRSDSKGPGKRQGPGPERPGS